MKLIIDIPEELAKKQWYTDKEIWKVIRTVWNGTPIPDNATNGDVLDKIRADIEAARYGLINDGLDVALRIIDKHIEGSK